MSLTQNKDRGKLKLETIRVIPIFMTTMREKYTGWKHKATSKTIQNGLKISGPQFRAMIAYLRIGDEEHNILPQPICSDRRGYWYPVASKTIDPVIQVLMDRRNQLQRMINGLRTAQKDMESQT